jgi:mono/diheme cytochrome c family protein
MRFLREFAPGTITGVLVTVTLLGTGCKPKGEGAGTAGASDAAKIATGRTVYGAKGCGRCHSLGGQGGRMGPDLTRTGADPQHTPQWLVEQVKNPKSHRPGSRMPAYEGQISENDLQALGAYLASLK